MKVDVSARGGDRETLHVLTQKTSKHLIGQQKNLRLYQEFKPIQTL